MINLAPSAMTLGSMVLGINADACLNDLMTNAVNLKVTNYVFCFLRLISPFAYGILWHLGFTHSLQYTIYGMFFFMFLMIALLYIKSTAECNVCVHEFNSFVSKITYLMTYVN